MAKLSPAEIDQLLAGTSVAHLKTLRADGSPHTAIVWYEYRDGRYVVFTGTRACKVKHLRRDRRVPLSVATDSEPYRYVVAEGCAEHEEGHKPPPDDPA